VLPLARNRRRVNHRLGLKPRNLRQSGGHGRGGADKFAVEAEEVTGEERDRLFARQAEL